MSRATRCLIYIVFALIALGIVVLASASGVKGQSSVGDASYFVKRQLLWLAVAVVASIICSRLDYRIWQKFAIPLIVGATVLLGLVLLDGIGIEKNGSQRWFRLGPASLQPSELAKFGVVVSVSAWMVHVGRKAERFVEGFALPLAAVGFVCGLVLLEPDYGTTVLIGTVGMIIMFVAGTRFNYLAVASVLAAAALSLAVMTDDNRSQRILAFLDPEANPASAYQLIESKNAFILGAVFGVGPGHSAQKHRFLPEAHTDFILAIVGEELGLTTLLVVLAYMGLMVCGLLIALRAPTLFGRYLAFGLTVLVVLQAAINVGVVSGVLPTKGLALPFISYGGTSLVMSLVYVGVLVNIGSQALSPGHDAARTAIKDRAHKV